jgi:mRNA interferase RelE/StbE
LSSPAGWRVEFTIRAARDARRLDPPVRRRVYDALERLVGEHATGDVIRLKGSDEWRLRVGDWRVLFRRDPAARVILVLRVLPRGRAYRD